MTPQTPSGALDSSASSGAGTGQGNSPASPAASAGSKAPGSAKLVLREVSKSFAGRGRQVLALDRISLSVRDGEFVCLVGPSGCGKSTLLNIIAGLEHPYSVTVTCDGHPIEDPGSDRMMMFQESALFPWLDVMGNVLFGLKLKEGLTDRQRKETAEFYLRLVGLQDFARSYVHELSGGMRQRVALARALAPEPRMLLMDEPFGALDALTRENLYADLQNIFAQQRRTILFVTHNVREAVCLGDRVILFSPNPGRVQEQFDIALDRPRNINSVDLAEYATGITRALKRNLKPAQEPIAE